MLCIVVIRTATRAPPAPVVTRRAPQGTSGEGTSDGSTQEELEPELEPEPQVGLEPEPEPEPEPGDSAGSGRLSVRTADEQPSLPAWLADSGSSSDSGASCRQSLSGYAWSSPA